MTSKELIELSREYENSDSVSRRKEIWDSVEYATIIVFRNLCRYLDGYAEQHNVSVEWPADCYFSWDCSRDYLPCDDPDGPLNSPGVAVTYEMANGQESVLTIPYEYFDCTGDDWEKMLEEKNAKALANLEANLKIEKAREDAEENDFFDKTKKYTRGDSATVSHMEVMARIEALRDQLGEMGRHLTEFGETLGRLSLDMTSAVRRN